VFGIVPVRPETGYGYVYAEKPALAADAWPVVRFVEKPDPASAALYIRSGRYLWNSGIFLWENRTLLALFRQYLPATYRSLRELEPLIGRRSGAVDLRRRFTELQRISIDYGILEKAGGLRLVPAEFAWDDIGNWSALERALSARMRPWTLAAALSTPMRER
jgi:mannose-1-phosphate guanylyltransferase